MEENITVAVRMRPLAKDEKGREVWKLDSDSNTITWNDEMSNASRSLSFTYDYAYGPQTKQTMEIYENVGSTIAYSVMEGYNGIGSKCYDYIQWHIHSLITFVDEFSNEFSIKTID